jgi:hypothetical protein
MMIAIGQGLRSPSAASASVENTRDEERPLDLFHVCQQEAPEALCFFGPGRRAACSALFVPPRGAAGARGPPAAPSAIIPLAAEPATTVPGRRGWVRKHVLVHGDVLLPPRRVHDRSAEASCAPDRLGAPARCPTKRRIATSSSFPKPPPRVPPARVPSGERSRVPPSAAPGKGCRSCG